MNKQMEYTVILLCCLTFLRNETFCDITSNLGYQIHSNKICAIQSTKAFGPLLPRVVRVSH